MIAGTKLIGRRRFLSAGAGLVTGCVGFGLLHRPAWPADPPTDSLIAEIERAVIFPGRQAGVTWFHPRPCMIPTVKGPEALMTLQSISGSDVFGPVHWTTSKDIGRIWSKPEPIPGLGRRWLGEGWEEGTCDVVPEFHPPTRTVLAVGHNVYYKDGVLARPQRRRWPVYVVRSHDGHWSEPRRLEWDDPRATAIYTCGCSQRVTKQDGDVLIPLSFGPEGRPFRSVTTALCSFDGEEVRIRQVGDELINKAGRGLLEPSLVYLDGRYCMTIRAEDGRSYAAASEDGLRWEPQRPWCWDDGEPLTMSTTQQHWLPHSEDLFLVYTRKSEENAGVNRWRAPLYVAQVDRRNLRLIRATERVVLPLIGDGIGDPKHVAGMGNFHTIAAAPGESWMTVGEEFPGNGWRGDTLLARIRWGRPNHLAPA
jgi:hypothetical protein